MLASNHSLKDSPGIHVAIIGGGFTGLACALSLLKAGYRVTVLEAQHRPGGLTTSFNFGAFTWDKFYHCILTSDSALLQLLEELGLSGELRWKSTEVGFFSHDTLYRMTGARELLRFPHLSLLNKTRLALGTLYAARLEDGNALESVPLEAWTKRIFGKRVYEEIWEPLLRCKLGETRSRASAAFLWATLRRLYSTREKGPKKQEKLGYVHGGYQVVFKALSERILALGGTLQSGAKILGIREHGSAVVIDEGASSTTYDAAVLTIPNRAIAAVLETSDTAYLTRLTEVEYLGLVCMVLVLKRRLSPFYVTNITQAAPFTGLIEMTNLIDPEIETAGQHLVYLPKYTVPNDPLITASDDDVWEEFAPALFKMHPDLKRSEIAGRFVFRERVVQPVPTLHYSRILPAATTPLSRVFLANTSRIVNNTLNNNVMTRIAHEACQQLMARIPVERETPHPEDDASARGANPVYAVVSEGVAVQ